jgi:hypothetical protein
MPKINRAPVSATRAAGENAVLGIGVGTPIANIATGWLESIGAPDYLTGNMGAIMVVLVAFGMHVARDRGWLPGGALSGLPKAGIVLPLCLALTGCTGMIGTITPHEFTVRDTTGEAALVVACEVKGVAWGGGDGGICRVDDEGYVNTVEGGNMGETFKDFGLGILEAAGRVVGGLFGGIGGAFSAIGAGASSDAP